MSIYKKQIIKHADLYIAAFTQSRDFPYLLFVHGGPGLNSGVLEYLIENENIFNDLKFNVILYDQRGCGRSAPVHDRKILHSDNVHDLKEVYNIISEDNKYKIAAIIGHSYGAKLLCDYIQSYQIKIPTIFIATAASMLTPRINNLLLDLAYLKEVDKDKYAETLEEFDNYNQESLWRITEKLAKIFQENKNRPYFYWANLIWQEKVKKIQELISLPINTAVFTSVRQDLYTQPDKMSVDIDKLTSSSYLWINGMHDVIMNGSSALTDNHSSVRLFFKSAHYPHIEENEKFCGEINAFLQKN